MSRTMMPVARRLAVAGFLLLMAGCATTGQPAATKGDRFEHANRKIYAFNDAIDRGVLKPVAKGYVKVTPKVVRTGISNFFDNLTYPATIVNQLLQGKVVQAGQDTARFLLNTTLGWAGFIDVASGANLPRHNEDSGQTLGKWGVPPGPYLMVPFLGPSTVRDLPARIADEFLRPLHYYGSTDARWGSLGLSLVSDRASLLPLDKTLERVYDKYGFIRDAYLQKRQYDVYDGNPPEEPIDEDPEDPEAGDGGDAPPQ